MRPVTIFAGFALAAALAANAAAADKGVATPGINRALDNMIDARMNAELRPHALPAAATTPAVEIHVIELGPQWPAAIECPCVEYVYRWSREAPAL